MWTELRKAAQHALGVMVGAVLTAVVIFESGYFENPETAELRRLLREDLTKLKETVALHDILLSQTSRTRGKAPVPMPDGSYQTDPREGPFEQIPPGKLYRLGVMIDGAKPGGGSARQLPAR